MPYFSFTITRDTTESARVVVRARNIEQAQARALTRSFENDPTQVRFYPDDCAGDTYLPDPDDYETISAEAAAVHFRELKRPRYQHFKSDTEVRAFIEATMRGALKGEFIDGKGVKGHVNGGADPTIVQNMIADIEQFLRRL